MELVLELEVAVEEERVLGRDGLGPVACWESTCWSWDGMISAGWCGWDGVCAGWFGAGELVGGCVCGAVVLGFSCFDWWSCAMRALWRAGKGYIWERERVKV